MPNGSWGERPGPLDQGGSSASVSDQWTEQVLEQFDPCAPTRSHESPAGASYQADDGASHAMPAPCEDSEFGAAGMPKSRYRATIASQTL